MLQTTQLLHLLLKVIFPKYALPDDKTTGSTQQLLRRTDAGSPENKLLVHNNLQATLNLLQTLYLSKCLKRKKYDLQLKLCFCPKF